MSTQENQDQLEVTAIQGISEVFRKLNDETRRRIVRWMIDKYQINQKHNSIVVSQNWDVVNGQTGNSPEGDHSDETGFKENARSSSSSAGLLPSAGLAYENFADLYNAASPSTEADRALVSAYWLQEHQSEDSIDAQAINTNLKELGHPIDNITRALANNAPQYVRLLRKDGSTKQARKHYKVTVEGYNRVKSMLPGNSQVLQKKISPSLNAGRTRPINITDSEQAKRPLTENKSRTLSQMTTRTIAARIGCKKGTDLAIAAAAQLTLFQGFETFTRQQLLDEMKQATTFFQKSYRANLTNYIQTLLKQRKLLEQASDTYALAAEERATMEKTLDHPGSA